jgi:hypothetical protein
VTLTEYLDQLDQAHAEGTPGPWRLDDDTDGCGHVVSDRPTGTAAYVAEPHSSYADGALIVAAVNALPELIAALRAVLAECEALEDDRSVGIEGDYTDSAFRIRTAITAALTPAEVSA